MATSSSPDPVIAEVLDFWFSLNLNGWFINSSDYDQEITSRFGDLVNKARLSDDLDSWASTPSGALAQIILLDQFTRNIYRPGTHSEPGLSWSGDAKALQIASRAIAKGYDRQIQEEFASTSFMGYAHRFFMYMPYMHAEDVHCQIASCALFDGLSCEFELARWKAGNGQKEPTESEKALLFMFDSSRDMARKHLDCVVQLGRFPKRNEPLGRETSEAEKKFLEEHPYGF